MINKRYLIKKLLDYPEITKSEYLNLIKLKETEINNPDYLEEINNKINLYNDKEVIMEILKYPPQLSNIYFKTN
jgi:hypothetical protein